MKKSCHAAVYEEENKFISYPEYFAHGRLLNQYKGCIYLFVLIPVHSTTELYHCTVAVNSTVGLQFFLPT